MLKDDELDQRRHDVTREQLEMLRDQQMYLEQARQQARAEAMREILNLRGGQ